MNEEDFEVLRSGMVYMDSACVSLKPKQVVAAMNEYYSDYPACAGRSAHRLGDEVTHRVEKARKRLARYLGAREKEIIFTRNTTEGINIVAKSLDLKGGVVLTTDKEHNSNLLPWINLAQKGAIKHKIIKSDEDNSFSMENYEELLHEGDVKLVSVNHSSNLDGMTNPIEEITKLAHKNGALVLLDAAQSAGHKDINVRKLDVDFLACSGHKMCGPSGMGLLFGKHDALEILQPFLLGGDTVKESWYDRFELEDLPERFEAGLQNYAGIIGFEAAADYIDRIGRERIAKHETKLNALLTDAVSKLPVKILGNKDPELRGGIVSFYHEKVDPHEIALILNSANIFVRSGAFCVHSWFNRHKLKGAVRFSSYLYNNEEDVHKVADFLEKGVKGLLN